MSQPSHVPHIIASMRQVEKKHEFLAFSWTDWYFSGRFFSSWDAAIILWWITVSPFASSSLVTFQLLIQRFSGTEIEIEMMAFCHKIGSSSLEIKRVCFKTQASPALSPSWLMSGWTCLSQSQSYERSSAGWELDEFSDENGHKHV